MMMMKKVLIALAFLFTLGQSAVANPINYELIDARLRLLIDRDDMMGLAVAIVENGQITFVKGYGYTELGGSKVDENTAFRWASVSKGLSGTLAAQMAHEGKLSLDSHLSEWRTTLRLPGAGESVATVRDLLSHQLGLVPNAYDNKIEGGADPAKVRATLAGLKPICKVGSCHGYQNVAFDTISEILEASTGKDFETLTRERVFDPLGMTSAKVTYNGFISSTNFAKPHSWSSRSNALYRSSITLPYFKVAAAGGVSSSIRDLAIYMQAQMGLRPDVFHPEALKVSHEPLVDTALRKPATDREDQVETAAYGLGWRIYTYKGHRLIGHQGMVRGTRALILFDPVLNTGVVAAWNSSSSRPKGLQLEVMDMAYGLPPRDRMDLMDKPN